MGYHPAMLLEDLWSGEMVGLTLQGKRVLLVNLEGTVHAFEDRCAHLGIPLSRGRLEGDTLTCGAHGWVYDARTGRGRNPCHVRLRRYPVRIQDDQVQVDIGDER